MYGTIGRSAYVKMFDENSVEAGMLSPESFRAEAGVPMAIRLKLELPHFALARIDCLATTTR